MKLAVLGVGLIGGSIGLAARARLDAEVVGFDPDPETLRRAAEHGVLDSSAAGVGEAVEGAEAVFCAGPVGALPGLVADALARTGDRCVVSDVGSTKLGLSEAVAGEPGAARFIGGHPLAGAETAGVEHSRADLFEGALWYLTPTPSSEGASFERLRKLVAGFGARPHAIDPGEHDRLMATVSHLPHVVANVLVSQAVESLSGGDRRPEVGRSFRDATRVAGANPAIWGDIFSSNADAIADEIDAVTDRLRRASALLREGDPDRVREWQARAQGERRTLLEERLAGGPQRELRIAVENRPGTVAQIALALGEAGVNIEDMSLFPSSDRRSGAISLWVTGDEQAVRAAGVVSELGHRVTVVSGGD